MRRLNRRLDALLAYLTAFENFLLYHFMEPSTEESKRAHDFVMEKQ